MSFSVGIVGLPNVGKSTLFETITKKQVPRENYPFCTIDPNIGVVAVPDKRVDKLAQLTNSQRKIYTTIEFVDIAGLVKGASAGEGLGNKFLAHIRETDIIVCVLRCFRKSDVVNTLNVIDPLLEKETLETELILKDLETVDKRIITLEKDVKSGKKESVLEFNTFKKAQQLLHQGKLLLDSEWQDEEKKFLKSFHFLTFKPRIYLLNGLREEINPQILTVFQDNQWKYLIMDISTEFDAANFTPDERESIGLPRESELDVLIKSAYQLIDLITFFTTGPDETRAWTLKRGLKAPQAGGVIHSDFENKFIKAEIISYEDFIKAGSNAKAKELGLIRSEGKDYIMHDGDIAYFKI